MKTNKKINSSKSQASFSWMLLPLLTFVLITVAVLVERVGFRTEEHNSNLPFLPPVVKSELNQNIEPVSCLIISDGLTDDELKIDETFAVVFSQTRIACDKIAAQDLTTEMISKYDRFVIAFYNLDLLKETINPLFDKVSNGGGILFAIRPDPGLTFQAIYRKMGISMKADRLDNVNGVSFKEHLLLGALNTDTTYDFFHHGSLPVQLDPIVKIYATSADNYQVPLIWRAELGTGKVVVINTDQFSATDSAGILFASYGLLNDTFVYPVINSWTFYLDQFPGPFTTSQTPSIQKEFGRDDHSFFINNWWPDVLNLTKKYDTEITGLVIQSFTDNPKPPFAHEGNEEDYEYLTSAIIDNGGEVGLVGFNDQPYCDILTAADQNALENNGITTAVTFIEHLLKQTSETLTTIAPPYAEECLQVESLAPLSENARVLVSRTDPNTAENQEIGGFAEFSDGTIRIRKDTAGYKLSQLEEWRLMNNATLHYALSTGITSYDVINPGADSWSQLRSDLDDQLLWIRSSYPTIRSTTATDAAKAIQRYSRLGIRLIENGSSLTIEIDGFVDEAWLIIISDRTVGTIDGGTVTKINGSKYLLRADHSVVNIVWKE